MTLKELLVVLHSLEDEEAPVYIRYDNDSLLNRHQVKKVTVVRIADLGQPTSTRIVISGEA